MKALKYLSYVGILAGIFTVVDIFPLGDPKSGLIIFAVASIIKDAANRFGDLLDDGKPNGSFKT